VVQSWGCVLRAYDTVVISKRTTLMEPDKTIIIKEDRPLQRLAVYGVVAVAILGLGYLLFNVPFSDFVPDSPAVEKNKRHTLSYMQSVLQDDPKTLQEQFVQSVRDGVNDRYTKADAYFLTHRYLDNGGNIYELYDYIEQHPELAFLKEAEALKPSIFKQIKDRTLPSTYNGYSLHAYLAYLEVLDKYGYADVAALATAANQYAKTAWTVRAQPEAFPPGYDVKRHYKYMEEYALLFARKAQADVAAILDGRLTEDELLPHSIVVALNQQASTLRYFQDLGVAFSSTNTPEQMFAASRGYSKTRVPWLYLFSCFLDASTLRIVSPEKIAEINSALQPVYLSELAVPGQNANSMLRKIVDSKSEVVSFFPGTNVPDLHLDIYGKRNVVSLARIVPEFREWLLKNGWQDTDFAIAHPEWSAGL
jgi:hypothetical protein